MTNYLIKRLLLVPLTLFCIVLVNFVIMNLAPGDPITVTEISAQGGAVRRADRSFAFGSDERYLQFREHFGLTLPILFNLWPNIDVASLRQSLWQLIHHKESPGSPEMSLKTYEALRIQVGDQARFVMPLLLQIAEDPKTDSATQRMAMRFFIRGGTRQAIVGPTITPSEREYNRKIAQDNDLLTSLFPGDSDSEKDIQNKLLQLQHWYDKNKVDYTFEPNGWQKVRIFFLETRFCTYLGRVLTLNFGTLRNDPNKTVISEVIKRFRYSLTLSILPMFITFFLCQIIGFTMAYKRNQWPDHSLNLLCLILYAIPIFVVVPFLIENIALHYNFPFTNTPIPISGFTSPDAIYDSELSYQRLFDIFQHITLPLIAIMYGSLAAQARLSRTAVLEVLRQDYVRTAFAKGASPTTVLVKHVGRNAGITIITSIAGSLGIVLGGSLIVETLFEINGFGKFFYDAVINRDYNVIMFSTLAGSLLTLIGFIVADIAYTVLDPRVTLE